MAVYGLVGSGLAPGLFRRDSVSAARRSRRPSSAHRSPWMWPGGRGTWHGRPGGRQRGRSGAELLTPLGSFVTPGPALWARPPALACGGSASCPPQASLVQLSPSPQHLLTSGGHSSVFRGHGEPGVAPSGPSLCNYTSPPCRLGALGGCASSQSSSGKWSLKPPSPHPG